MEMEGATVRMDPFHIIDNIYYVGTKFVASHLFASKSGHILIDAGMPSDGPHILANIKKLGFDCCEIRYLVITHGHIDHLGSADYIAKEADAKVCIGEEDATTAEHRALVRFDRFGKPLNEEISVEISREKAKFGLAPSPIKVDQRLHEGDEIRLDGISLEVLHTPGHTAGTCSLSFRAKEGSKEYQGMLSGGIGINVFREEYLRMNVGGASIKNYISSLERLRSIEADLWLEGHPFFNQALEKMERLEKARDKVNPFIDPEGRMSFLDTSLLEARDVSKRLKISQ